MTLRRSLGLLAILALLPLIGACATSPATGRSFFTGGLSSEDEAQLGAQQHGQVLKEFGGTYDDPKLANYVSSLGTLLARTSELPDLKFTFTVIDSPIVNAFALPGGYVYVTRGLVALADDEAELAGVLAHEIGHVTARHSAERYGQAVAANLATAGLGIIFGATEGQMAEGLSALVLRSWSRDQEFEADMLGVRYLTQAGFSPDAMASFLSRLQAHSRLEAEIEGNPGAADSFSLLQTHPRTADRIERAADQAGVVPVADPIVGRDIYLNQIDGMIYGDSPKNGFVRGRVFYHPILRFRFEAPPGFRIINSQTRVLAVGPKPAGISFDLAPESQGRDPLDYLVNVWAKGLQLDGVERLDINGMAAATGHLRSNTRGGARDFRLITIRYDNTYMYRFLFVTAPEQTAQLGEAFRRTTYSFRKLSAAEAGALKPNRLRIHQVRAGDTPQSLSAQFPFDTFKLERFVVLNGIPANANLTPGQRVKIITE